MNQKILVYATQLLDTGGIESHILEFCKQLSPYVKIDLLVLNSCISDVQKEQYECYCNKLILIKSKFKLIRLWRLISNRRELRRNHYDAIYTNGQGNSILFVKQLLGKQKNWVHHHHTSGDSLDQSYWTPKYIEAMQQADHVVACSHTNAKDISNALNRKIEFIYCFSRAVNSTNRSKFDENRISLGYFGRLIREKGIEIICKMSEELENIVFHIWGTPSTYNEHFFKQYPNLHYHGKFEGIEGLKNALSVLDGFLLLSTHSEGLPISLLEVTSSGTPWLASDKGGIRDIAFDAYSTKVISSEVSYSEMKEAVLQFVTDIQTGKTSSENLKGFYEENFSVKTLLHQWFSILGLIPTNDKVSLQDIEHA